MFLHGTAVFDSVCESARPIFPVYFPLSCFYNILYSSLLLQLIVCWIGALSCCNCARNLSFSNPEKCQCIVTID